MRVDKSLELLAPVSACGAACAYALWDDVRRDVDVKGRKLRKAVRYDIGGKSCHLRCRQREIGRGRVMQQGEAYGRDAVGACFDDRTHCTRIGHRISAIAAVVDAREQEVRAARHHRVQSQFDAVHRRARDAEYLCIAVVGVSAYAQARLRSEPTTAPIGGVPVPL